MHDRKTRDDLTCFIVLLAVISGIFYALAPGPAAAAAGAGRIFNIGLMWSPAAAALLTLRIRKLDFASIGWGWGENKWIGLAYLLPLGYAAFAYFLVWALGLGTFGDAASASALGRSLGWTQASQATILFGYVLSMATLGMVSALATALGEEIGWRGFLAPRLVAQTNFTAGAVIVGVIMLLWHLPVILFGVYNQGTSPWIAIPCFAVAVISASVVSTWLRQRSGSVWPSTVFHGAHNLFIQGIFTPLTAAKGVVTAYVIGEFGLFVPTLLLALAICFWARRRDLPSPAASAP